MEDMKNRYYCNGYIGNPVDGWSDTDLMSDEEFNNEMNRLFPGDLITEAYESGDITENDFYRWNHILV